MFLRILPSYPVLRFNQLISIRLAEFSDADKLLAWRNNDLVRNNCLDNHLISRDEHLDWMNKALLSENMYVCIAQTYNDDVGVVNFTLSEARTVASVSIYLNPDYIGKGYGGKVLSSGILFLKSKIISIEKIQAVVLEENIPSMKIFKKYGFKVTSLNLEVCV